MNILITGARRGIGLATAKQLDGSGNKLFLVATSQGFVQNTFQNAVLFGTDSTKPEEISKLADSIDVLITMRVSA